MAIKFQVEDKEKELAKENKKSLKIKKSKKAKFEIFLMFLAIIATLFMIVYVAIPVASVVVGIFAYLFVTLIILVICACTLFLIFISKEIREEMSKYYNICNKILSGGTEAQKALNSVFPIIAPICVSLVILSLVYSIIVFKKNNDALLKRNYKAKMIVNIFITSICLIFVIVDLIMYLSTR